MTSNETTLPTQVKTVPNLFPPVPSPTFRLAVIGDFPEEDDYTANAPFSGTAGRLLRGTLANCNIATAHVFFGNICQEVIRQPRFGEVTPTESQISAGVNLLDQDLAQFSPHCILLLGKTPFRVARPDLCYKGRGDNDNIPLSEWRGSIFLGTGQPPFSNHKCVATYHPTHVFKTWADSPFFKFDVARAVHQAGFPNFTPLIRTGNLRPSLDDVLTFIAHARTTHTPITFDIEGYPDVVGCTMVSLVPTETPDRGIVIPFRSSGNYWSDEEEPVIWGALAGLLYDPLVPKTAHNCFYELFVLAWRHRMVICNLADDTMMMHWERHPDFAKADDESKQQFSSTQKKRSLGVCCSLYTEQEYYKDDRLSDDSTVKLNYNFLDSSVTAECKNVLERYLRTVPSSFAHYRFNISLVPPYTYLMLRGCKFDTEKAQALAAEVTGEIAELTQQINKELLERGVFDSFPLSKADEKKRYSLGFNVKSPKQKCWLIYEHLKQKPLARWGVTSDEDALLHFFNKTRDPLLRLVIRCVRKRTRLSDIGKLTPDSDGRIRSSYDLVGTNSGRLSSRASMAMRYTEVDGWTHTGTNFQNQTKDLRVTFTPDSPDHDFFQADLAGADAWTVAAELKALGHSAMWEDLLFGIKPSLVLYFMIQEHAAGRDPTLVNRLNKDELKSKTRSIKQHLDSVEGTNDPVTGRPNDWLYITCKRVQHGSNYDMHAQRTCELVFGDSDGTIDLSKKDAELYQYFYKLRYKTDARNDWIRKTLQETSCIITSCGIRRKFFGIRNRRDIDDAIVREASAVNPQANTTYITNRALAGLWYDPTNRRANGSLFIEPLIQIHDAVAGQFDRRYRDFAAALIKRAFTVPLTIAGTIVNIPVDCKYGTNWKDCKHPL